MKTKIDPLKYKSGFELLMNELERPKYIQQKELEGWRLAAEDMVLHVGSNGVWWADHPNHHRHVQGFERIGYHTLAEHLLVGFLKGNGRCFFHGFDGIVGEVTL